MKKLCLWFVVLLIVACVGCSNDAPDDERAPPDFSAYTDVQQKKRDFLDFLYPLIVQANKEVALELVAINKLAASSLSLKKKMIALHKLCEKYKIACDDADVADIVILLRQQVDMVPPSIALAQAANESAWGTSRFAREANNYFGQWCFSDGCGLVPKRRAENATHEVRAFKTVMASVRSYVHNLNTSHAYESFRQQRSALRQQGKPLAGKALVKGLSTYSERGDEYVKEIKKLMYQNKLHLYDERFLLVAEKLAET